MHTHTHKYELFHLNFLIVSFFFLVPIIDWSFLLAFTPLNFKIFLYMLSIRNIVEHYKNPSRDLLSSSTLSDF